MRALGIHFAVAGEVGLPVMADPAAQSTLLGCFPGVEAVLPRRGTGERRNAEKRMPALGWVRLIQKICNQRIQVAVAATSLLSAFWHLNVKMEGLRWRSPVRSTSPNLNESGEVDCHPSPEPRGTWYIGSAGPAACQLVTWSPDRIQSNRAGSSYILPKTWSLADVTGLSQRETSSRWHRLDRR